MKLIMALTVFALFGMGGAKAEPLKEGDPAPDFALKARKLRSLVFISSMSC